MALLQKDIFQYEKLTEGMELEFSALSFDFLRHCENIIFGIENKEIKHFCFHLHNDNYLNGVYEYFSGYIEEIFSKVNSFEFPELKNNLANLLIYLREPKAKSGDKEYKYVNYKYWREIVYQDECLVKHPSFRKYII